MPFKLYQSKFHAFTLMRAWVRVNARKYSLLFLYNSDPIPTTKDGRLLSLKLSPFKSLPSSYLADEATDLLTAICGSVWPIDTDSKEDFKADAIRPCLSFFLSEALEQTVSDFVAVVGEDVLANAIETTDSGVKPDESDLWIPLHLLSFCGAFVRDFLFY